MLHDIGVELQAELRDRGCPFPVVDGPEPTGAATYARERVVIEHAPDDRFDPVVGTRAHANPKNVVVRWVAATVTIYARSAKANATAAEHRQKAEQVLDQVLVGLTVVGAKRRQPVEFAGGEFVIPKDLEKSGAQAGAAYALKVGIPRGVFDRTWVGEARPEVPVPSVTTTDKVRDPSHANNPETGC